MTKTTTTTNATSKVSSAKTSSVASATKGSQRFAPTTVGRWLSSKTAIKLADCQRGEVFDASFVRGLKKSVLSHWPIAPVCVTENKNPDGTFYVLFDGQQRTAAMREARKTCTVEELTAFDSAPLYLEIVCLPSDLSEGEFFRYRNTNNAPTKAQANLGNYTERVRDVIHAVTSPSLINSLYARQTKADGFEISRVGKLDDLIQALALALIKPEAASTNFADVSKSLASIGNNGIDDETYQRAMERAELKCDAIGKALKTIAADEDLKKMYRSICLPKVLVPMFAGTGTDSGAIVAAIKAMFGADGKATQIAAIPDYKSSNDDVPIAIDWYSLMTEERSNSASANRKRIAFFAREYTKAKMRLKNEEMKRQQIEAEMDKITDEAPADL